MVVIIIVGLVCLVVGFAVGYFVGAVHVVLDYEENGPPPRTDGSNTYREKNDG